MEEVLLEKLNREQKEAVQETEGFIRVIAGAGTGKTRVLTTRYVYLAKVFGISPDHILSVTFTNKAANEMKRRIQRYMKDVEGGWIVTFHGACHKILKEDVTYLSYPKNFSILDESDQKQLLSKIYGEYRLTTRNFGTYESILEKISDYKGKCDYVPFLTDPENTLLPDGLPQYNIPRTDDFVIFQYLKEQRKSYYLDFDDLMTFTLYLFDHNRKIKEKWQNYFEYIQVDEFQDVSSRQYHFASLLAEKHKNLFVVGDPDQTIYSWRGADIGIFNDFPADKTVILTKNYRSTQEILDASNSLIKHNSNRIEKELVATVDNGWRPRCYHAKTVEDESNWIVTNIQKLQEDGVSLNEIAVLYRANSYSRKVEERLMKSRVPYVLYSGYKFYERAEIKTSLCYLKLLTSDDDLAFERVYNTPTRGIGRQKHAVIQDLAKTANISMYAALKQLTETNPAFHCATGFVNTIERGRALLSEKNPFDVFDFILKQSGFEAELMLDGNEERLENVTELKSSLKEFCNNGGERVTLNDYFNHFALLTDADKEERLKESVKMMTVHTAKGLEFSYVFVCGLNERIFPSVRVKNLEDMEEERRIAYVAYTRAKKGLFLSDAISYHANSPDLMYPSRFILNVDENLLSVGGHINADFLKEAKRYVESDEDRLHASSMDTSKFQIGDFVFHPKFGKGEVLSVDNMGREFTIRFGERTRTFSANSPIWNLAETGKTVHYVLSQPVAKSLDLSKLTGTPTYYHKNGVIVCSVDRKEDYDFLTSAIILNSLKKDVFAPYHLEIEIECKAQRI